MTAICTLYLKILTVLYLNLEKFQFDWFLKKNILQKAFYNMLNITAFEQNQTIQISPQNAVLIYPLFLLLN